MVIKKKTLYIVLPIVVVVILFTTYISYLMGWFGNSSKLDKFQDISNICKVENRLFSLSIKCDAFLEWIEYEDGGSKCLNYSLIKDYSGLESLKICDKDVAISTDNPVYDTDMKVPVYLNFIYKYKFPFSYTLSNVSMDVMEDEDSLKLIKNLSDAGIDISNIRVSKVVETEQKGYYFYEADEIIDGVNLGRITFTKSIINNVSVVNDEIVFDLSVIIDGVENKIEQRVKQIFYLANIEDETMSTITVSNISEIDKNRSYSISFIYIPKDSDISIESIDKECNGIGTIAKNLCDKREAFETLTLDLDIEEYVQNSFDKLIVDYIITNE